MRTDEFNDLEIPEDKGLSVYDAAKIISMPFSYASKFLAMDRYAKRAEVGYITKGTQMSMRPLHE